MCGRPHGRACVDSVDHAKLNCPHGPHACAGVFWRGRSVDNVDRLDRRLKSAAYNIVYTYCIHFTFFILFIFLLSTWSTIPIFSGAPCGQIRPRTLSAFLSAWSTFCKLIVYIGFWSPYVNQSLTSVGTILSCYICERVVKINPFKCNKIVYTIN
jgi:hypothetical protein